jgi:cellulose biosynthesis protein BcsQ
MKKIAFFNNKGGVGKTTLVYHLAWMFAERGQKVLAVDFDPQANLTAMFLDEERLEALWSDEVRPLTVFGSVRPILKGLGDIGQPHVEMLSQHLGLIPGDLGLSEFEDKLSDAWPRCHNRDESAFRIMTAFHRMILFGAQWGAEIVLIDVGPNLGAINRAALIAADHVLVPLGADLFSLQGLKNLGPSIRGWRQVWQELLSKAPPDLEVPTGQINPMGYVVSQHGIRETRIVKSYQRWLARIPEAYRSAVLQEDVLDVPSPDSDPYALALLKHYRSLMPMAMDARKPMFRLSSADGAIGAHVEAVRQCHKDFSQLARRMATEVGIDMA